ncbi:MAG: response regulator, partial [Acidobacteria bacterium]|nr:response regulator [Acidobacteriota bacterium]
METMSEYGSLSVLLIEDNPGDARLIQEALAEAPAERFQLVHAERLSSGVARLSEENFDLILLDLSLPDGDRLETLVKLRAHEPNLPVVVLTGLSDEAMAIQAVQAGAQDYLV